MRRGTRLTLWSVGLLAALAVTALVSAVTGPVDVGYVAVGKVVLSALPMFDYDVPTTARTIVMVLRLPRIALAAVVGFALATAGVVMQGFFRNPMADPSIIGVSSGAAVGAVATIAFSVSVPLSFSVSGPLAFSVSIPLALPLFAFVGALLAAFGVYALATENGRTPVATLLLAGVAVQTLLGAVVSLMLLYSGESLRQAVFWLMGHLKNASWWEVGVALLPTLLGFVVLQAYAEDLNVLLLGEEDAHTLGVEVERTKRILLAVASVVTAAAVAMSGIIGFVGLVVPHVMRLLVGPDHRILLPTSALAGATFLVATDTVARSAVGGAELPVGIVTAFLGAPFFLYLLRSREVTAL
ncbi:vitamin B12 ABC transporter permease BtuC [Halomicrococcus gelatinilyticus]|uniref:vitamin B12 ABC transporter permease BtuC n=1 Tax=Halomicrococcus gelatinilyticus TaxID=1702103 RepID=UPI002E0F2B77